MHTSPRAQNYIHPKMITVIAVNQPPLIKAYLIFIQKNKSFSNLKTVPQDKAVFHSTLETS